MFRITREHREQLAKSAHAFGTTAKNNLKHILAKHEKKLKGQKDLSKDKQRHVHDAVSYWTPLVHDAVSCLTPHVHYAVDH